VARVDIDDDSIERHVAFHFRYDPARRQRRHVAVAAFDSEAECEAFLDQANADLRAQQAARQAEVWEHVSGKVYEPGYARRQQNARLLKRALEHGVWPSQLDVEDLPASVGVLRAGRERSRASWQQSFWQRIRRWTRRRSGITGGPQLY
jgi:hypothetical protein